MKSVEEQVTEAVRDGLITMHRHVNGPNGGPHADYYRYSLTVAGRLPPSWQQVYRGMSEAGAFRPPTFPPNFSAASGIVRPREGDAPPTTPQP